MFEPNAFIMTTFRKMSFWVMLSLFLYACAGDNSYQEKIEAEADSVVDALANSIEQMLQEMEMTDSTEVVNTEQ